MHFTLYILGLKEALLIQKTSVIAIVLFLSAICLSKVAAQDNLHCTLTLGEQLINWQRLETSNPQEGSVSSAPPGKEGIPVEALESFMNGELNDDFNFPVLFEDSGKKEPDFDIPIVINDRVEEFIELFQTTIRDRFVTWLARSGRYIP